MLHRNRQVYCFLLTSTVLFCSACGAKQEIDTDRAVTSIVTAMPAEATETPKENYRFADEDDDEVGVPYLQVAWTAFQDLWEPEDYAEFQMFLPALKSETAIRWQEEDDDEDAEPAFSGNKTMQTAFDDYDEFPEGISGLKIDYLYFWDFTGEGDKELILRTTYRYPGYIVLHRINRRIYGQVWSYRWFASPGQNGYFYSGKGMHISHLYLENERLENRYIGSEKPETNESGEYISKYTLYGESVSETEYETWIRENKGDDVPEYAPAIRIDGEQADNAQN